MKAAGDSVGALIDALLKSIDGATAKSTNGINLIDAISKEVGFSESLRFASAVGRRQGFKDISPELLMAGAFLAYREGLLRKRPAVCAHLAASERSIKALIETEGWMYEKPAQEGSALPLAPSVEKALKEVEHDSDPLIVALSAGIETGAKILLKKRVAYHEAGHAVISNILRPTLRITEVTIIDVKDTCGHVSYDSASPYYKVTRRREDFLDDICVSLAGRVAEQKEYGHDEVDAGASSDLKSATEMAWDAITKWGLDFEFGPVNLAVVAKAGATSTGWLFDQAQRRLHEVLKEGLQRTETLIAENWVKIEAVAEVLFKKKKLTEDDLLTIMGDTDSKDEPELKS